MPKVPPPPPPEKEESQIREPILRFVQRVQAEIEAQNGGGPVALPEGLQVRYPEGQKPAPADNGKHPGGRPRDWNREAIIAGLYYYMENTRVPILKDFTSSIRMTYEQLRHQAEKDPELAQAIKILLEKKEAMLETGMLINKLNAIGSIFSLKQLGWRDFVDINNRIELSPERKKIVDDMLNKIVLSVPHIDKAE